MTTVLDVKIHMYPTHAASKPVAIIPNCAATRHAHFVLDGSGPVYLDPPALSDWPAISWTPDVEKSTRVNLDTLTREEVASWKPGQTLLLNGKMLTGRDAAHKRIQDMLAKGEELPVDFTNRVIYYVGPVDPVRDEVVGPAGREAEGASVRRRPPLRRGTSEDSCRGENVRAIGIRSGSMTPCGRVPAVFYCRE